MGTFNGWPCAPSPCHVWFVPLALAKYEIHANRGYLVCLLSQRLAGLSSCHVERELHLLLLGCWPRAWRQLIVCERQLLVAGLAGHGGGD